MKNLKATHGTAIYTGGGFYICIGELNDGTYFYGGMFSCEIFDKDTRTENEDKDLECFYEEWCKKHRIASEANGKNHGEIIEMFKDFCKRLDAEEEGLTDGYEEYNNYCPGEVYDMMLFDED